jgi:hypothetical protein
MTNGKEKPLEARLKIFNSAGEPKFMKHHSEPSPQAANSALKNQNCYGS